jgi:putative sigma-54 modulation protein
VDIIVKSKRCDVPERVKDDARSRVAHATRFYDRLSAVEVVLSAEVNPRIADRATVEVAGRVRGRWIRAEAAAPDHRAAIELAVTRFERQLVRLKARRVARHHGRARHGVAPRRILTPAAPIALAQPTPPPLITETVTVHAAPMLPEDAAHELLDSGSECLMFNDVRTGLCNVVFRRANGEVVHVRAAVPEASAG